MKKLFTYLLSAMMIFAVSCEGFDDSDIWRKLDEYGESIRDHEQRISALEELCKQMNTNIEALQTLVAALEQRDYVTNVSEVRSNGEVIGYTISFGKSDTITIYHGQNGKDGANGKDGYIPQIGVMEDTDDIYYWTLDGEWLLDAKGNKIKAVGADGKDGQDGTNGTDGKDGQNGTDGKDGVDGTNGQDGKDGVMPQLKIENDYWYVSYDNGETWEQLGKATGEDGKDGIDGEDGNSIFSSVTQDDENVYFNLADGTTITLPKHDTENIQFEDLQVKAICCRNWDTNNDGELSYAEAAAVTDIGDEFEDNDNIIAFTELKYFTGISEIPEEAFDDCDYLWKVVLPENITTIGDYAFDACSDLTSITIPDSVTSIESHAFEFCSSLASVTIPDSVTSIGDYAFKDCSSLAEFKGKFASEDGRCLIVNGVLNSFAPAAKLTEYTIPEGVTSIGDYAFEDCSSLASVTIPDSVTSIGVAAFEDCSSLASVTIPDSVTEIGNYAFAYCYHLTSINIPDSVTSIGDSAFRACESLTSITIPDSVTSIGDSAFDYCSSLTSIDIPNSVTSIGNYAFSGCSSLTSVYCKPTTPPTGGYDMFYKGYYPIRYKIYVPAASVDAYKSSSYWSYYYSYIEGYDF